MAGMQCDGALIGRAKNGDPRNSKAFCDGMAYRAAGTALEQPLTDNPFPVGSEQAVAWSRGWERADNNAGGTISNSDAGCCAMRGASVQI